MNMPLCSKSFKLIETGNDLARCYLGDIWPDPTPVAPAYHGMHLVLIIYLGHRLLAFITAGCIQ